MNLLDFLKQALEQTRQDTLRVFQGFPEDRLIWRPSPRVNHALFLLWHVARVEDFWIRSYIQHQPELWQAAKLYDKFGLPERDTGRGFDVSRLEQLSFPDRDTLKEYLREVRENTVKFLKGLDEGKLDQLPNSDRPQFTIGRVLLQMIRHENQHLGAMEYLSGLLEETPTG